MAEPPPCHLCVRSTPSDEVIEYEVRGSRYRLAVCFVHQTQFDTFMQRMMFRSELLPDRPRYQAPPLSPVRPAPPEPVVARPSFDNGPRLERRQSLRAELPSDMRAWTLTEHARMRALQRGFPVEQVLRCAARPAFTTPGDTQNTRAHFLDDMLLIVDPSTKDVITVMFRRDDDYQTWLRAHPAATA
jgi:hypothetical protein